ncbi:hypothetical protein FRC07_002804 [Ceratobasidium sp. 392]|nr:hypothetical protein FRC07_002804 [Ceratobasidium sp. 392]
MLGAIYEFCPFVTQVSGYVRMIIVWMFGHKHAHGDTVFRYPTLKDMQALLWLANNARDPAVIDCSYQALAGLHRPPESSLDIGPVALSKSDPNDHLPPIIPLQLDEETTLKSLLSIMIDRYEKLTTGSLHLINNPEMSAARYLNAILALAAHIRRLPDQRTAADGFGRNENGDIALSNMEPGMDSANTGLPISLSKLLTMTESLWNSDELRFRADTYASLLAAGFEIVQLVIASHFSKPTSRNRRPSDGGSFAETRSMESKDAHIIDVTPPDLNSYQEHKLHDIRAYYSRWLVRVSTLLCLHANNQITIGSWQLNKLLRSVAAAAGIDILNPPGSISTHHPQNEVSSHQTYRFVVPFGEGRDYTIRSDDLRMGPLGSLVDLLRKRPGSKDESMITTCYAALEAYAALAPVLLQQVLGLSRPELAAAFSRDNWTDAPTTDIAGMRYIAMRQALLTARYLALSRTTSRRHFKFAADVFDLMDVCMDGDDTTSFQNGSYLALAHYNNELVPILELIGQDDANLELVPGGMKFDLTNIAQVWVDNRHVTPLEYSSTPNCWPPLIRMLEKAKLPTTGVNRMLQAMIRRLRSAETSGRETVAPWDQTPAIQYLYCFTHTPYVLASLAQTGSHKKYTKAVVMGITQIVHLAAGNDPGLIVDPVELRSDAVPGFLDAASLVTKYCSGVADRNKMLLEFLVDVSQLLKIAAGDSASRQFLAQHSAVLDMWGALRRIEGDESALQLATQLRAAGEQLGINFQDRKSRRSKKAKTRAAKKRYSSSDDSSGEGSGSEEEEASEDFQSKEAGTTDDDASDEEGVSNEEGSSSSSDSSSESDDDSS